MTYSPFLSRVLRGMLGLGVAAIVAFSWLPTLADNPKPAQGDQRRSMGNLRPPATDDSSKTRHTYPTKPTSSVYRSSPAVAVDVYRRYHGRYPKYRVPHVHYYPYSPYYGSPYYYVPSHIYRRSAWSNPWNVHRAVPLANQLAARQLAAQQLAIQNQAARNLRQAQDNVGQVEPKPKPAPAPGRGTNARSVALSGRFIGYGDIQFRKGEYFEAMTRYRKAVDAAPRFGDAYFRKGYALAAVGRYADAAKAFRRGIEFDSDWPDSGFHNSQLYRENAEAKAAHLETAAELSEEKPHDADLLLVLGVYLYFDGDKAGAASFFQEVSRLSGGSDLCAKAFLAE